MCGEQRESIGRTDLQIDLQEPAARFESAAFQKKIFLRMRAASHDGKATQDRHEDVGVVAGDVLPMRQVQACLTEARLEFQKSVGGPNLLDGQHIRPDGGEGFSDLAACGFGLGNPGAGSFHEVIFQVVGDNLETRGFRDEEESPEKRGKQQS